MTDKETGMLDVGEHCNFCRQIDFLPFRCTVCEYDYCALHRSKESHNCKGLKTPRVERATSAERVSYKKGNGETYFKTLLPGKAEERIKQEVPVPSNQGVKSSLRDRLIKNNNTKALDKLKRFFDKYSSKSKYKMNLTASNKTIQLATMRRNAKGDVKIPQTNRLYVWCYYIDDKEPIEHEIFISKTWPVGRALDSLLHYMKLNNAGMGTTANANERLLLYKKVKDSEWVMLEAANRVSSVITEGDALYVVRGNDVEKLVNQNR
ncbi:HBR488Wp [Eremothecium sinecaudum]|uniref:HBR488Wp n=1 Tax=Eremothecium sinecaudum TaxID=45286 RepID=A0A109UXN0_9SACH|nr:HBR488Wp [Eremothecium sinecaudum]AMD19389.1 HBR488Wp [Eremothecium sinecaudum]